MQVFDKDGITETIDTAQGGGREPHVAVPCFCDMTIHGGMVMTENARCLQARYHKGASGHTAETSGVAIPVLTPDRAEKRQNGRRFKENGEPAFTLTAQDKHGVAVNVEPIGVIDPQGRIGKEVEPSDTCPTPRTQSHGNEPEVVIATDAEESEHDGIYVQLSEDVTVYAIWYEKYQCYIAIRRLTPKECFRLQGWEDNYFEMAQFVNSDSQLYRQAGNGVTVNVIYEMAKKMEVQNE